MYREIRPNILKEVTCTESFSEQNAWDNFWVKKLRLNEALVPSRKVAGLITDEVIEPIV
jgi:hypothetical protein